MGSNILAGVKIFKSMCTNQLSEQEKQMNVLSVFKLDPPGVTQADWDYLEATQQAHGIQGQPAHFSVNIY